MAASDATAIPIKNQAYRITFPILDADGDLVTGAAALDSEVSKDAGTFADCTNEATEIATSSGMYYLDLTATEMNADTVAVIVKTTTSGAKTTPIVLYPAEAGDVIVNVKAWNGTAVPSEHTAGYPIVTIKDGTGTGEIDTNAGAVVTVTNVSSANVTAIDAQATSGNNATLNLKQLNVQSSTGPAIYVKSTADDAAYVETTTTNKSALHLKAAVSGGKGLYGEANTAGVMDNTTSLGQVGSNVVDIQTNIGTPAATVSDDIAAVKTDTGNLISRLGAFTGSGVNTVLGFFKALLKKDGSTPSDVGGTYNPATDALEAQQEFLAGKLDVATSTRSSHSAADVWTAGTRTLTSFGTLTADTATAVWAAGTRTLTSFGTLVADVATAVWAAGTRTLTSFGTLVADVWAYATRTLTAASDPSGVTTLLSRIPGTVQPQTGDSYARLGAPAGISVSADVAAVKSDTGTTSTNVSTILNRLGAITGSGVNTVLGYFKALLSKVASTPTDIGGAFDPATDSTEAIRDRGDAAWGAGSVPSADDVAQAIMRRDADLDKAAAAKQSLCIAVHALTSKQVDDAGNLKTYAKDGTTLVLTQAITTDAAALPVKALGVGA